MSKSTYLVIGLITILVVLGLVALKIFKERNIDENLEQSQDFPIVLPLETPTPPLETAFPGETIIIYSDNGFNPNTITIKKGQTVIFKNESSRDLWPTSAVYPEKGNCGKSKFDACVKVGPGGIWRFTLDVPGSWQYNDRLRENVSGTIVVE